MTPPRATAYLGLASVLVAWLSGAAGLSVSSSPPAPQPRQAAPSETQIIADDVQAQTAKLRSRLSSAPAPRAPFRNPFMFATRPTSAISAAAAPRAVTAPVAAAPAEPVLQLVGVAEQETPAGTVRTALITPDSDELFMLVAGDALGGRYKVASVGADFVELVDLVTGATRRLTLK